jgi:hypothetical protein
MEDLEPEARREPGHQEEECVFQEGRPQVDEDEDSESPLDHGHFQGLSFLIKLSENIAALPPIAECTHIAPG